MMMQIDRYLSINKISHVPKTCKIDIEPDRNRVGDESKNDVSISEMCPRPRISLG